MRLEELLPEVVRRWWVVLLGAFVAGGVAVAIVPDEPDSYTASARLYASAEPADYWLDLYAKNRLATYEPLINNYDFVQRALEDAGLSIDPSHAQSVLQVSHDAGRNTLTITVVDEDAERAAQIANAVQAAFLALIEEQNAALVERVEEQTDSFTPRIVVSALDTANPPSSPDATDTRTIVFAAAILGAIAGCVIIFFLVYRDDTLRSTEDIERFVDRPVLGTVPNAPELAER